MKQAKGYVSTLLSAIIYGSGPLMVTLVYRSGFGVNAVSFLRVIFPVPVLALIVILRRESFVIRGRQIIKILFLGVMGSVLTSQLLFRAINHIDTGTATALNFTYPVLVILLDKILYKKRSNRYLWIAVALCFAGVMLFCNPYGTFTWKGFFLALGSALSFGLYVLYLDRSEIMEEMGFYSFTFYFFLISAVLTFPFALLTGELSGTIQPMGWLLAAGFSLLDGLLATLFQQYGIETIGGRAASILSAVEPVTSASLGAIFLHEIIQARNICGMVLIIISTVYLMVKGSAQQDPL